MKVLFLDHDGVVCLNKNFGTRFKKGDPKLSQDMREKDILNRFDNFDEKSLKVLNEIITETNCEIVVSSDWKRWATVEEMGVYYEHHGIIKKPFDFTPSLSDVEVPSDFIWIKEYDLEQCRALEIKDWLNKHPEVTHWVSVDDLYMGISQTDIKENHVWGLSNFVWCPSVYEGIKQSGIKDKIVKFLL